MHFRLRFADAIHQELVAELEKGAAHASAHLARLRVTNDRCAADIECTDGADAEVTEKVQKLVEAMSRRFRSLGEPEEIARTTRRDEQPIASDALAELERRRWVRPLGRGQVGLAGGAFALRRYLDEAVRDLARTRFRATEEDYPVLLEPSVLARSGYLSSFPHAVCFVSHLTEDFDAIEAFRAANTDTSAIHVPDAGAMTHAAAALRPAVCLPVYAALEGTALPRGGIAITTTGRAFRYESRNMEGIQRLWDFSMREIVFLGSAVDLEARRDGLVDAVIALLDAWDLGARLVSASDPFFATVRGTKALWQRTRALKHEVLVDVGDRSIAVGSINHAGPLFADAFHIRTADGETAATACVGFGLERLVLALFSQHGFAPDRWPRPMREVIFG